MQGNSYYIGQFHKLEIQCAGGRCCVIPYGMFVPVPLRWVTNCYTPFTYLTCLQCRCDNVTVVSAKPATTKQWQKFVAAVDTATPEQPQPSPPAPTTVDDDNDITTTSSAAAKSTSAVSVGDEPKDEIDMKLQDFLAVSHHSHFASLLP